MIIPYRHVETPFDFNADEWADFGEILNEAKRYLSQYQPDGFTIGWNVGSAGGQHVFHAHLHIICRYRNDLSGGRGLRDFVLR
ncbi:HIT domain-containing protein [Hyphomicrobium methylovorum]|uniref:HIT domain-containing protein n=1 Tax=Hyphomicrobium methylovorum TaxID=84 RepID=UPI0015E75F7B|nr:HIT domain-containing protein [Hyphomicrobium methylovorum]